VVDLQGLLKSGILTFFARGKRKIALNGGREGSPLFVSERVAFPGPDIHALERYLWVARYLGAKDFAQQGTIPVQETDKRYIDSFLAEVRDDIPLIAINPMAKWETKLWELDRFASLADKINEHCTAQIVFTGNEGDKGAIETILSAMKSSALNMAGKTTLKQLAYLYQRCAVVVSTDTGPMHIAASMDSPVVIALFGPTSPLRTGPYGAKHRVIGAGMACSPCFKKKCDDKSCMREITVDQVFETVTHVISDSRELKYQKPD
jgi:3-deoxy-D-manno-octulosonic-acid transferase/heptosyltransferase-1